jgi:hypothetical protein
MKLPRHDPDVMLASDGHLYAVAASLPRAARTGRRVLRVVALTPREEEEIRRRIGDLTGELLVGLTAKKGGVR